MTGLTPMTPPVTQAARDAAADLAEAENCPPKIVACFRDGTFDDNCRTLAFAKAIAEEAARTAKVAEDFKATGYMSDRERDYCQAHGEEIATAIRATAGEVGNG